LFLVSFTKTGVALSPLRVYPDGKLFYGPAAPFYANIYIRKSNTLKRVFLTEEIKGAINVAND
jgi:hypothetical protein